jgi:protein phosphatase
MGNAPAQSSRKSLRAYGFAMSHVGAVRKRNEDAVHIDPQGRYALLADGMGGHRGGQEASTTAVQAMRVHLDGFLAQPENERLECEIFLQKAFIETSAQIYAEGSRNPALNQMGTTLVAWMLMHHEAIVAHSGDSRCYLIRDKMIFQTTPDHTLENEHILLGKSRAQVEAMPLKHVLSRNVGMMPTTPPDVLRFPTKPGDIWLLCSDGLSNKLSAAEILWHVLAGRGQLPKSARGLVEHAFVAGGEDNITCCLMGLEGERHRKT